MKVPALEALMGELIKDDPDLELIRREAKKLGLRVTGGDLTKIMAQVLEETQKTAPRKTRSSREVNP